MASLNQDKTTNRVAFCSAIFAGFAYVGYTVVKQAFGGIRAKLGGGSNGVNNSTGFFRDDDDLLGLEYEQPNKGHKIYLRRLSGSSASQGKLLNGWDKNQEEEGNLRCILRPLSVRERIRELNLNAHTFADTLLVLHGKKPALYGPRSLQSSPFHSPDRIMSPADLHLSFLHHRDEDLKKRDSNDNYPNDRSLSRMGSRPNLMMGRRSLTNSVVNLTEEQQEEADSRAESLLHEKEDELTKRLEGFQSSRPRELTPYEARCLVALLHSMDKEKIARTLVTISNCAAFTRNQDSLREAGILVRLPALLGGPDRDVQIAAVMATSNLALNIGNMKEMEQVVSVLVLLTDNTSSENDPELMLQLLLALTNLAVSTDWHKQFLPLLPHLVDILLHQSTSSSVRLQTSRLLINLAFNDEMVGPLLSVKCTKPAISFLLDSDNLPEDQILRSVTLLANLAMSATRQKLVINSEDSLYDQLFQKEMVMIIKQTEMLMKDHGSPDIRSQARKLNISLAGLPS